MFSRYVREHNVKRAPESWMPHRAVKPVRGQVAPLARGESAAATTATAAAAAAF
jgi:hypothetical protein